MVAEVVDVDAQRDHRTARFRKGHERIHQRRLAPVATIAAVGSIVVVVHFDGDDLDGLQSPLGRERPAVGELVAGQ
jgi:hypothetical protein